MRGSSAGEKLCSELYPSLYHDETSVRLIDQIDYDFSEAEKNSRSLMQRFGAWDSRLQVTSRGCMLGYNDLKDPSVGGFFRFLARVGDGGMKMQIVKIRFTGKN